VDGFRGISYVDPSGQEVTPTIRLLSPNPDDNEWLAVNQVTLRQGDYKRRFDVVLYCNGMPVSIIELKKASSQSAGVAAAHAPTADLPARVPDGVPLRSVRGRQ